MRGRGRERERGGGWYDGRRRRHIPCCCRYARHASSAVFITFGIKIGFTAHNATRHDTTRHTAREHMARRRRETEGGRLQSSGLVSGVPLRRAVSTDRALGVERMYPSNTYSEASHATCTQQRRTESVKRVRQKLRSRGRVPSLRRLEHANTECDRRETAPQITDTLWAQARLSSSKVCLKPE
jgi:hypothetical protein